MRTYFTEPFFLSATLQHLDDTANASKAFEQGVKLDPDDPGIRINYGSLLFSLGYRAQALEQLNYFNQLAQHVPKLDPEVKNTQIGYMHFYFLLLVFFYFKGRCSNKIMSVV